MLKLACTNTCSYEAKPVSLRILHARGEHSSEYEMNGIAHAAGRSIRRVYNSLRRAGTAIKHSCKQRRTHRMVRNRKSPSKGAQIATLLKLEVTSYRELTVDSYFDAIYKPVGKEQKIEIAESAEYAACATAEYCAQFRTHFLTYYLVDSEPDIYECLKKYYNFLISIMCDTLSDEVVWCKWLTAYAVNKENWGQKRKKIQLLVCKALHLPARTSPIQMHRITAMINILRESTDPRLISDNAGDEEEDE